MNKYDHVRDALRSGHTGGHHCHWPGCNQAVPPAAWGCRKHWYALPQRLRNRIWAEFRAGQEITKTPSRTYVSAAVEVQRWIAKKELGLV